MMYDFLIVGSGMFGSVFANLAHAEGYKCLVLEKRDHIGGNCYTERIEGIDVHKYGAHIFHTNDEETWNYVNKFAKFNNYRHHVIASYNDSFYSLPFNMWTFKQMWGVTKPADARRIIESQKFGGIPTNLEEQALSMVGTDIYERLIRGYTAKQWDCDPRNLPSFIIKRLPVRFTYDNNYYFDRYQGIPENGYTELFDNLLSGIDVEVGVDYIKHRQRYDKMAKKVVYTGPIDRFFDYFHGKLEYRPLRFEHKVLDVDNYQGHSVINYTDQKVPYTRILEHKHFYYKNTNKTVITHEYPEKWQEGSEPYYPVNDERNSAMYDAYKNLCDGQNNIIFGGRLSEYKYYDMHQVVASATTKFKKVVGKI